MKSSVPPIMEEDNNQVDFFSNILDEHTSAVLNLAKKTAASHQPDFLDFVNKSTSITNHTFFQSSLLFTELYWVTFCNKLINRAPDESTLSYAQFKISPFEAQKKYLSFLEGKMNSHFFGLVLFKKLKLQTSLLPLLTISWEHTNNYFKCIYHLFNENNSDGFNLEEYYQRSIQYYLCLMQYSDQYILLCSAEKKNIYLLDIHFSLLCSYANILYILGKNDEAQLTIAKAKELLIHLPLNFMNRDAQSCYNAIKSSLREPSLFQRSIEEMLLLLTTVETGFNQNSCHHIASLSLKEIDNALKDIDEWHETLNKDNNIQKKFNNTAFEKFKKTCNLFLQLQNLPWEITLYNRPLTLRLRKLCIQWRLFLNFSSSYFDQKLKNITQLWTKCIIEKAMQKAAYTPLPYPHSPDFLLAAEYINDHKSTAESPEIFLESFNKVSQNIPLDSLPRINLLYFLISHQFSPFSEDSIRSAGTFDLLHFISMAFSRLFENFNDDPFIKHDLHSQIFFLTHCQIADEYFTEAKNFILLTLSQPIDSKSAFTSREITWNKCEGILQMYLKTITFFISQKSKMDAQNSLAKAEDLFQLLRTHSHALVEKTSSCETHIDEDFQKLFIQTKDSKKISFSMDFQEIATQIENFKKVLFSMDFQENVNPSAILNIILKHTALLSKIENDFLPNSFYKTQEKLPFFISDVEKIEKYLQKLFTTNKISKVQFNQICIKLKATFKHFSNIEQYKNKQQLLEILSKGNVLFKKWATFFEKKLSSSQTQVDINHRLLDFSNRFAALHTTLSHLPVKKAKKAQTESLPQLIKIESHFLISQSTSKNPPLPSHKTKRKKSKNKTKKSHIRSPKTAIIYSKLQKNKNSSSLSALTQKMEQLDISTSSSSSLASTAHSVLPVSESSSKLLVYPPLPLSTSPFFSNADVKKSFLNFNQSILPGEYIPIPPFLKEIFKIVEAAGFEIYIYGGYVRDMILQNRGKKVIYNDIELITNCPADNFIKLIPCQRMQSPLPLFRFSKIVEILCATELKPDLTINSFLANKNGQTADPYGVIADIDNNSLRFLRNIEDVLKDPKVVWRLIYVSTHVNKMIPQEYHSKLRAHANDIHSLPFHVYSSIINKVFLRGNALANFTLMQNLKFPFDNMLFGTESFISDMLFNIDNDYINKNGFHSYQHILALFMLPYLYKEELSTSFKDLTKACKYLISDFCDNYRGTFLTTADKTAFKKSTCSILNSYGMQLIGYLQNFHNYGSSQKTYTPTYSNALLSSQQFTSTLKLASHMKK